MKFDIELEGNAEEFEMTAKKDGGEKLTITKIDKDHLNGLAGDAKAYCRSYFEQVLEQMLGK